MILWAFVGLICGISAAPPDAACIIEPGRAYSGVRVQREWTVAETPQKSHKFVPRPDKISLADLIRTERLRSGIPIVSPTSRSRIVIVQCDLGKVRDEVFVDADTPLFNVTHCSSSNCYRIARRKRDLYRPPITVSIPGRILGGVYTAPFQDNGTSIKTQLTPKSPIIVEPYGKWFTSASRQRLSIRLPLMRSPDITEKSYPRDSAWSTHLAIDECYAR